MLMMFGSLGCPAEKRRLADAHDVWLLGGAPQKRRLADAHDVWLLGVPRRNAGLLMLMMFGSLGCLAETQAC